MNGKRKGESLEAIRYFRSAIAEEPTLSSAWLNLGIAYADLGLEEDAIVAYEVRQCRRLLSGYPTPSDAVAAKHHGGALNVEANHVTSIPLGAMGTTTCSSDLLMFFAGTCCVDVSVVTQMPSPSLGTDPYKLHLRRT